MLQFSTKEEELFLIYQNSLETYRGSTNTISLILYMFALKSLGVVNRPHKQIWA